MGFCGYQFELSIISQISSAICRASAPQNLLDRNITLARIYYDHFNRLCLFCSQGQNVAIFNNGKKAIFINNDFCFRRRGQRSSLRIPLAFLLSFRLFNATFARFCRFWYTVSTHFFVLTVNQYLFYLRFSLAALQLLAFDMKNECHHYWTTIT